MRSDVTSIPKPLCVEHAVWRNFQVQVIFIYSQYVIQQITQAPGSF
jgi:hypothetical protein